MNAALYYPWVYLKSGVERTIARLLAHSRHDWTIYTNRFERDATFPELQGARVVELPRVSVRRSVDNVLGAAWQIARQKLPLADEEVLLVFCEGLGDFVTFRNRSIPAVCMCLTPLRAAFDPHYQAGYIAMHGGGMRRRAMLSGLATAFRLADRLAWRNYAHVFAISREVEARIRRGGLRAPGDDVEVVLPGIETGELAPTWRYDPYFLLPGRIMWTKNIELAIEAFAAFRRRYPSLGHMRLVIAGFVDEKSRPYIARLRALAASIGNIDFVESPTDEDLFRLYQSAYALIYPPFNEDWGLVPLEGMALGKPVVAVDRGGPRETILDGRTGFLRPPEPAAFAECMGRLGSSLEVTMQMGAAAHQHAQQFDSRAFARQVDDGLERVVAAAKLERAQHGRTAPQMSDGPAMSGGDTR